MKATSPISENNGHAGVSDAMRKRLVEHMKGIERVSFEIKPAPRVESGPYFHRHDRRLFADLLVGNNS